MKTRILVGVVVLLFLVSLSNPVSGKPTTYTPPIITGVNLLGHSYDGYPATVSFECVVQWDPAAFQRYVWLYSSAGDRYTMYYDSYEGPYKYKYTVTAAVNPWEAHSFYIKAREIIQFDYISLDSYYYNAGVVSALTSESYSKPSYQKWAVIIQGTNNDNSNDYWAHKNAFDDMNDTVYDLDFLDTQIATVDLSNCFDEQVGYGQIENALEFPMENEASPDDFIFIFIVSHGGGDGIKVLNSLTFEFSTMDTIFDATDYDRMVIVIETCNAGDGLDDLEEDDRCIITSADDHLAQIKDAETGSYCYFSKYFISSVDDKPFGYAFYNASDTIYNLWLNDQIPGVWQDPQINYNSRGRISLDCCEC